MLPDPQNRQDSLKDCILAKIETGELCVKPRYVFWLKESLIWLLWLFVIFLGALAVSVSSFVLGSRHFSLYEATHENFLAFLIEVAPGLWLSVFVIMIVVAIFDLRQTRRGYRYSALTLGGSSLLIGLLFGIGLHNLGAGFVVDRWLGEQVDDYFSQAKLDLKLWQQPELGRLVGVSNSEFIDPDTDKEIVFTDSSGRNWQTDISELQREEKSILKEKKRVKLVGLMKDKNESTFHACGVLPWVYDQYHPLEDLSVMDRKIRERLVAHQKRRPLPPEASPSTAMKQDSHCSEIAWLGRLREGELAY